MWKKDLQRKHNLFTGYCDNKTANYMNSILSKNVFRTVRESKRNV